MPRFFLPSLDGDPITLSGPDAAHIARTLRFRPGDTLTLSDGRGTDALAELTSVSPNRVEMRILSRFSNRTEPRLRVFLYAALPKSDGAELIVQKGVEMGAAGITFFLSEFTVRRPDDYSSRLSRLNRIAREAAGQSGRGRIPEVRGLLTFDEALREAAACALPLFCYEGGGEPVSALPFTRSADCAILTGPEGGFSEAEVRGAEAAGLRVCTLGPRILRCETAPLTALACAMFAAGEYDVSAPRICSDGGI